MLQALFADGLRDVDLRQVLADALPEPPSSRVCVVGAGKAAAQMAAAVEASWGDRVCGAVIVPDGYGTPLQAVDVIEASHPVPDDRGRKAAAQILDLVSGSSSDDVIVGLWSGGASSLMVAPVPGLSLEAKQAITSDLLRSGAPIQDINTVRKHLSTVKGGKLAQAAGDRFMLNFIVSDVVGDDLSVIGSGPTVPDQTTCGDALRILERYQVTLPAEVWTALIEGDYETPVVLCENIQNTLIQSPADLLHAIERRAQAAGYHVVNLGDEIEGEARAIGEDMAKRALDLIDVQDVGAALILSGGEATVTHGDGGVGGPNLEFALALALALNGSQGIWALAADSDGRDGVSGVAGALVDPNTLARACAAGVDPESCLKSHDSKKVFESAGDLFVTGPTGTNLNDVRMVMIQLQQGLSRSSSTG